MSGRRYTEEFKAEAARQVIDQGRAVREVADRLGVSVHSLYEWVRVHRKAPRDQQADAALATENRRLQAELRRITEERDILKKPRRTLPRGKGEVRVHASPFATVPGGEHVPGPGRTTQRVLCLAAPAAQRSPARGPASAGSDQAGLAGERHGLRLPQDRRRPAGPGRTLRQASCGAVIRLRSIRGIGFPGKGN